MCDKLNSCFCRHGKWEALRLHFASDHERLSISLSQPRDQVSDSWKLHPVNFVWCFHAHPAFLSRYGDEGDNFYIVALACAMSMSLWCLCMSLSLECESLITGLFQSRGKSFKQFWWQPLSTDAWCHGRSSVESSTFSLTARFSRQIHTWITRKQQTHLNSFCIHITLSVLGFLDLLFFIFSMWAGVMFIDSYIQCSFWSCFWSRLTTLPRRGKAAWWRCQCPTKVAIHTTNTNKLHISIELVDKHCEKMTGDDSWMTTRDKAPLTFTDFPQLCLPTLPPKMGWATWGLWSRRRLRLRWSRVIV